MARAVAALVVSCGLLAGGAAAQSGQPAAPDAAPDQPAAQARPGAPAVKAKAWILIDPRDGAVLAAKASERRLPIASATKLMTAHLALRELKPARRLVAPAYDALPVESKVGLRPGEKMTVKDLLYGLIVESGNDAAVTLARGVSGSVPAFVNAMNQQASSLGLANTSFTNPIGLDAPGNFSSAADLAELAGRLLSNRLFARIADTEAVVLRSGDQPRRFTSRNKLLARDPSIDGVKTGHTMGAGWVLVGSATRAGTQLISVVLGAKSEGARDAETLKLLNYGFSLYSPQQAVRGGEQLADPTLDYRDERLPLLAADPITVSTRKGQRVETEIEAPDEISGAVEEGERLGQVIVSVDGRETGSAALVAERSVQAATLANKAIATAQNPAVLIPAGAFVIVVGMVLAARGRRSAGGERGPRGSDRPRQQAPQQRTAEERRKMHQERMRRRRQREEPRG